MNDVFYLSSSALELTDIYNSLMNFYNKDPSYSGFINEGNDAFQIYKNNKNLLDSFKLNSIDFECEEVLDNKKKIISIFCISFNPLNIDSVKEGLKHILSEFGGVIGSDADDFSPRYDRVTIENLHS